MGLYFLAFTLPGVQSQGGTTAAAATQLFDFLQLYEEQLVRWRDGFTP
jgi:hypothetical protein